jgi:hypothetical protein
VVGNSTALGLLVTNACAAEGLSLARLEDVGVDAAPAELERVLREALDDESVDAAVVVFAPPLQRRADEVATALRSVGASTTKPLVTTFLGLQGVPDQLAATGTTVPAPGSVPSYSSPERAVRALARAVRYAAWRREPVDTVPVLARMELPAARVLVEAALAEAPEGCGLSPEQAGRLLGTVGIVLSAEVPVDAVEVVVEVRDDPSFGALVSFGVAGVATDLLGDRAYAAVPLTTIGAEQLIRAPRAFPLLNGYSGAPAADLVALTDLVLRLSALAEATPALAECTVHVLAAPIGVHAMSVTARVAPPTARADTGPRRLRGF